MMDDIEAANTENLIQLLDPDLNDVAQVLHTRFSQRKYYTGLGDDLVAVNPNSEGSIPENSPQVGYQYCQRKPRRSHLSPHVFSMVHKIYNGVISSSSNRPHSVLVTGMSGSGKTEICQMVVAQFCREARISKTNPLVPVLMKGIWLVNRLTSINRSTNNNSSLSSNVVTLYFGQNGQLVTGKLNTHFLNARQLTGHSSTGQYSNCLYDTIAGLLNNGRGIDFDRYGRRNIDAILAALQRDKFSEHREMFMGIVETLELMAKYQNEDQESSLSLEVDGIVDVMIAITMLVSMKFDDVTMPGGISQTDRLLLGIATSALGVPQGSLEHIIMADLYKFEARQWSNDVCQARDELVCELYSRMINGVITLINKAMPQIQEEYTLVHIIDLPTYDDKPEGTLDTLCQNMVAERIQTFLFECGIRRPNMTFLKEGLKASSTTEPVCEKVVDIGFSIPNGLFHPLEKMSLSPEVSNKNIVTCLDKLFSTRKDIYTSLNKSGNTKGNKTGKTSDNAGFILHHSHTEVTYQVNKDFLIDNLIRPNSQSQRIFTTSSRTFVKNMYPAVNDGLSRDTQDTTYTYTTLTRIEVDRFLMTISGAIPHVIRCINLDHSPYVFGTNGFINQMSSTQKQNDDVIQQLKSTSILDFIQQKKYYFVHWLTLEHFIKRYGFLTPRRVLLSKENRESCMAVLQSVNIEKRGAVTSPNCVFLQSWAKEKLDHLAHLYLWRVKVVQACVRGHQTRKRLEEQFGPIFYSLKRQNDETRFEESIQDEKEKESEWLLKKLVNDTLLRFPEMPPDVWTKVIVLEEGKELAKVYASELSFHITASTSVFDEIEFGLGRYCYDTASRRTQWFIRHFEEGVEVKRDSDGSLLARRLTRQLVVVRKPSTGYLSWDLIQSQGTLPFNKFVKILDMIEFQSLIQLTYKKGTFTPESLMDKCVVTMDVGITSPSILDSALCLAVVSIAALVHLKDQKDISASLMTTQINLEQNDDDAFMKLIQEEAKQRRQRQKWSASDHRVMMKIHKEQNSRQIRDQLRQRGESINDHMKYSWQEERAIKASINMDQLYETRRRETNDVDMSATRGHQWAKIDVALRQTLRELNTIDSDSE